MSKIENILNIKNKTLGFALGGSLVASMLFMPTGNAEASGHIVQTNETLSEIADKYDTSISELKKVNDLNSDIIRVGAELFLGKAINYTIEQDVEVDKKHTLAVGETFEDVANMYGITVDELLEKNQIELENVFLLATKDLIVGKEIVRQEKQLLLGEDVDIIEKMTEFESVNGKLLKAEQVKIGVENELTVVKELNVEELLNPPVIVEQQTTTTYKTSTKARQVTVVNTAVSDATKLKYAKAIQTGMNHLGTPYVFGGTSWNGIDCSGFIYLTFKEAGINVPRTTALGFYNMATPVENPQVGDLVFFDNTYKAGISHIAIYIGNGEILHAAGSSVRIDKINNGYWNKKFAGFGRIQ